MLQPNSLFNDLILVLLVSFALFCPAGASGRTWHVPGDAPSIQGGIDLAQTGDDVLVAPGEYHEHNIALKAGVLVHSEAGPEETVVLPGSAGNGFICYSLTGKATVEGFTVHGGHYSNDPYAGGGISSYDSPLTIRNCIIDGCLGEIGGGIYSWFGDLEVDRCRVTGCTAMYEAGGIGAHGNDFSATVTDCELSGNQSGTWGGGGIDINNGHATIVRCVVFGNGAGVAGSGGIFCRLCPSVDIRDCVVTGNHSASYHEGSGMVIDNSNDAEVEGCTVAGNTGTSSAVLVDQSTPTLNRMIIAGNAGEGIACQYAQVNLRCCDIYGNSGGDSVACATDLGGNFSEDPLFCDPASGDYGLDANSPCLPGHDHGGVDCGLVGALGVGCGSAPTGACCLADGSCVVLQEPQCLDEHGSYQGDGTVCNPSPCQPVPVVQTTWGRIKSGYR